jgi:hypothetical protein
MTDTITMKDDYILVTPREAEFWEIWETLARLFQMPEYADKNVIWIFNPGPLNIAYDELYKIKDFLKENFPETAKPDKRTAIVVSTGLHTAMATEYIRLAEDLPVELRVFSEFRAAEKWITGK